MTNLNDFFETLGRCLEPIHFNTTHESGEMLKKYAAKEGNQNAKVLAIITQHYPSGATASNILRMFHDNTPITSIRRALSTLYDAGILDKTSERREGLYGRPECVYKLRDESAE